MPKIIQPRSLACVEEAKKETPSSSMAVNSKERDEIIYGFFHEKFNRNRMFKIILSRNDGVNFISMESLKREENSISWGKIGEIKMTLHRLEKIIRKAYDIEGDKNNILST